MPSGTPTNAMPARVKKGKRHSGPSWRAGSKNGLVVSSSGTGTDWATTSLLPVARNPITSQWSTTSAGAAGNHARRQSGPRSGTIRGASPSRTKPPMANHSACRQPLANGQRPDTEYP